MTYNQSDIEQGIAETLDVLTGLGQVESASEIQKRLQQVDRHDRNAVLQTFLEGFRNPFFRKLEAHKTLWHDIVSNLATRLTEGPFQRNPSPEGEPVDVNQDEGEANDMVQRIVTSLEEELLHVMDEEGLASLLHSLPFRVSQERARTLHAEQGIPAPKINASRFSLFSSEMVAHVAHEIQRDRLALEIARRTPVSGDGEIPFDEEIRETLFIKGAVAFSRRALELHLSSKRRLGSEDMARSLALMEEMAMSENISPRLKKEIDALTKRYLSAAVPKNKPTFLQQFRKLVATYRRIFQKSEPQYARRFI